MNKKYIYWFCSSEYPDESFFKNGNMKPSQDWCMFESELALWKHAFWYYNRYDDVLDGKKMPKTVKGYKLVLKGYLDDNSIIKIKLWDYKYKE